MDAIVTTNKGRIRGLQKTSQLGSAFYSFQGIPFAKPPVDELRFKAPVPADPWDGVLDATAEKPIPYYRYVTFKSLLQSEDCLYLNVYAKNVGSQSNSNE